MIRARVICSLMTILGWPLAMASSAPAPMPVPEDVFAGQPRGPYRTGTYEEMWVDARRQETTTSEPNDQRRLMVQIWYPAAYRGDPPRARYALHRELYPDGEDAQWMSAAAVRTNSVLNASLATQPPASDLW